MIRWPHLALFLALVACRGGEAAEGERHLEQLCDRERLREEYLDFYWDHLRSHQPELFSEALERCTEICPGAVNCGPVLTVASWYRPTPNPRRSP